MKNNNVIIDLNKLFDNIDNLTQRECEEIMDIANSVYAMLDIPVILLNDKKIKSNSMLIAMYLVGKEHGRVEQQKN